MKLKSKLIMSGVALAACAATLTSTTYAWYTTNTEVSATGISGAALESGASSIYISLNDTDWGQSVDLGEVLANNNGLVPIALDGTGTFRKLDNGGSTSTGFMASGTAASSEYVTFTLYFKTAKTSAPVDIFFKDLILKNAGSVKEVDNLLYNMDYTKVTSGTYSSSTTYFTYNPAYYTVATVTSSDFSTKKATLYTHDGSKYVKLADSATFDDEKTYYTYTASSYSEVTGAGKTALESEAGWKAAISNGLYVTAAGQTATNGAGVDRSTAKYGVDFIKALGMTTSAEDEGSTFAAYDLANVADKYKLVDKNVSLGENQNGALNYYNEVMGTNVVKPDNGEDENTLLALSTLEFNNGTNKNGSKICQVPADGTSVAVTFKIFLNGWDEYCYDSCKGQSFNMQMSFTSKKVA